MIQEHEVFKKPKDENVKIWRYMDFAKYLSILDKQALYFARVDCLEDKFEGKYPKNFFDPDFMTTLSPENRQIAENNENKLLKYNEFQRKCAVINCWTVKDYELSTMWEKYGKGKYGIAIQSTFKRLCDSFASYTEYDVYVGTVEYIDREIATIKWGNTLQPFVHKNIHYEDEKELRVLLSKNVLQELEKGNNSSKGIDIIEFPINGTIAKVDIQTLIQKVVISPKAENWFKDLVQSVTKKYGLEVTTIAESSIAIG